MGAVRVGGRQHQRVLGEKRKTGAADGLTRAMAEKALREVRGAIEEEAAQKAAQSLRRGDLDDRLSAVGERYCQHAETVKGRRPQTIQDYRLYLRCHLVPFFEDRPLAEIGVGDIEAFMHSQIEEKSLAPSTVANHVNLLHAVFKKGMREGVVNGNPVAAADKPTGHLLDRDIRFLEVEEVEALIRATTADDLGKTDAVLFLTAAMTGLRQGELIALRWRDIDWGAGVIRVRYSFTRGLLGQPKSKSSQRAVPMADRVATELERHHQRSRYREDDDLVFCHPHSGRYYVASTLLIRFKEALKAAGVRQVRFHDLRHTFATRMAAAGTPLRTLQAYMGHADIQTTMIYADFAPDATNGRIWAEKAFTPEEPVAMTAGIEG